MSSYHLKSLMLYPSINFLKRVIDAWFMDLRRIKTVEFINAPRYLKFNPYITSGYRVMLSPYQCFQSVFVWTNETVNVWSHVIGFCLFAGLLAYDIVTLLPDQQILISPADVTVAVFILLCFMICMVLSVIYHTFNCLSAEVYKQLLSYDILGISLSFYAIFFSGIYYGFWCPEKLFIRNIYLLLVSSVFFVSLMFVLQPKLSSPKYDKAKLRLFCGWAASGVLPTVHWLLLHLPKQDNLVEVFLPRIVVMYTISGAALFVYLYKLPEKFSPGWFDRFGSSHQLWHVLMVAALFYWHQTGLHYARMRSIHTCSPL